MLLWTIAALSVMSGAGAEPSAVAPGAKVVLHRAGQGPADDATLATLKKLAMGYLESSNFNTTGHPHILKQTVPMVQELYRKTVAGDYLLVTFDEPFTARTVGGDVSVHEIVIDVGRPDYAGPLFTIDAEGRVVGHGKYSGFIGVQLHKALPSR